MSFKNKRKNANRRGIEFTLTESQFKLLNRLKVRCAYTGVGFSGKNPPTLERIDNKRGYVFDNVIWVTNQANSVKCRYIESNGDLSTISKSDLEILNKIKESLKNPNLNKEYVQLMQPERNVDVIIASEYTQFCDANAKKGLTTKLTFAQFKKEYNRKLCYITRRRIEKRAFYIIDENKSIDDTNVRAIDSNTHSLLNAIKRNGFSKEQVLNILAQGE